jgi:hypothetical protein
MLGTREVLNISWVGHNSFNTKVVELRNLIVILLWDQQVYFDFNLDRIYRINWIFFFGRSPEESAQIPIASGEGGHAHRFIGILLALPKYITNMVFTVV